MPSTEQRLRILPLVVACPLFLQNLDALVLATALPAIAQSLQVQVLDLNLAITSYLLSLALFLPASAWLEERMGARRLFCTAVLLFTLGSAMCAMAQTLGQLVACRMLQGVGGSMMVPVGRTILIRNIPPTGMVRAMVWFTVPGAVGRLIGPLFGGAIVTFASWRWIFLVNIPFGLLGVALTLWLVDKDADPQDRPRRSFDFAGLLLLAAALLGLLGGLQMLGKKILPGAVVAAMALGGVLALWLYVRHSRRRDHPILDFGVLRFPTYRTCQLGGFPIRVAIGAAPFLLPLMLQVGFGMPALDAGMLTTGMAVGSLATRTAVARAMRAFGFRKLLVASSLLAGGFYLSWCLFTPDTPRVLVFVVLMLGGLCTSATMVTLATIGYSDVPAGRTGHATALAAMAQQLSGAVGVVAGAALVSLTAWLQRGSDAHLQASDFAPAFAAVALMAVTSGLSFRRLRPDVGSELR